MNKWMVALVAVLAVGFVAVSQVARAADGRSVHAHLGRLLQGDHGHGEGVEAHLDAMATWLELTPSQRKDVASVLTAALPGLEEKCLAVVKAHADQLALLHAAELDEEALRAASARAGALQGELAVAAARLLHDLHRLLSAEQLARLEHTHHTDLLDGFAEHIRGAGRDARTWAARQ